LIMKNDPNSSPSFVKMEQARKLLHEGQVQESLMLALDALLQELDQLREALLALQHATRPEGELLTPARPEEHDPMAPDWLPPVKPRVLH
jgi:hypothetical protein